MTEKQWVAKRLRDLEYRRRHGERILARQRDWRHARNAEQRAAILAYQRAWYASNRERERARKKAAYELHRTLMVEMTETGRSA